MSRRAHLGTLALAFLLAACEAPAAPDDGWAETSETGTGESGPESEPPGPTQLDADNPLVCDWPGDRIIIPISNGFCTECTCGPDGVLVDCDSLWFPCD